MIIQILYLLLTCGLIPTQTPSLQETYQEAIDEPESFIFVPPQGWMAADPSILPPSVKAMVVGKSDKHYPPSINIGVEPFEGSLKSYLKNVKMINEAQNATWKDLGTVNTESGAASLSSVDMTTEWGEVKLLHAIIVKYGRAYIMTCASLKEEFTPNYKQFIGAIHSIKINRDVYEMVGHPELRAKLMNEVQKLKKEWYQLAPETRSLTSPPFDSKWEAFEKTLKSDFSLLGPKWQLAMLEKAQKELKID